MGCAQSVQAAEARSTKLISSDSQEEVVVKSPPAAKSPAVALARSSPTSPLDVPGKCYRPEHREPARLQALLDCKMLDTPDERRFDAITSLVKELVQIPFAVVSLIDDDRLWFKSVASDLELSAREGNRIHSFCDAILREPNPKMMIVPDTREDARFRNSQFVAGAPYVRFYAGAPLISSEGLTLGTLTVMDVKPREFPIGGLQVIANFAELVVREIERDRSLAQRKAQSTLAARPHTVRALSCFYEAVILCDLSVPTWPVLFVNSRWCDMTGLDEGTCVSASLWKIFKASEEDQAAVMKRAAAAISTNTPFAVSLKGVKGTLTLDFRPATADHLSAAAPHIGIPNFCEGILPGSEKASSTLYFGVVRGTGSPATSADSAKAANAAYTGSSARTPGPSSAASSASWSDTASQLSFQTRSSFDLEFPEALKDVQLGPFVGSGAFGRVYRGSWRNTHVAVKVLVSWTDPESADSTAPVLEALLSKKLNHPNVVQTYEFATQLVNPAEAVRDDWGDDFEGDDFEDSPNPAASHDSKTGSQSSGKMQQQVWLVQQFCDHGTLSDALERGWLRERRERSAPPAMHAVLTTAQEIAAALCYLHDQGVLHGDLTANNVLLARAARGGDEGWDKRKFTVKIGDFGLSRVLDPSQGYLQTNTCGTISYAPLERIQQNLFTKASDVYSFGVLCWEMYMGQRAWSGRPAVQILYARTALKVRLELPADCPPDFKALVDACLDEDHTKRPSFEAVAEKLTALLATEELQLHE